MRSLVSGALLGIAIVTRLEGDYIGAGILRLSINASFTVGFSISNRKSVEMMIASIGFATGIMI